MKANLQNELGANVMAQGAESQSHNAVPAGVPAAGRLI